MAALQKIRSTGPLLIIALGLALFAFIAGDYFKVFDVFANNSRQTIGEIYGETYKYQQFQKDVEDLTSFMKFQKTLQGQSPELSSREQEMLRQQVWENFKRNTAITAEAQEAGLEVTDEDVQNALINGSMQYRSLGMLARLFPNQQTGAFDLMQYQQFLKEFDANIARFQQAGQGQAIEQFIEVRKLSEYALKQLKTEILESKFYQALVMGAVGNKVNAAFEFDNMNNKKTAEIVAIPYDSLNQDEIKVSEADIQNVYNEYKELFLNPTKTAQLEILDYMIRPSDADQKALQEEVEGVSKRLENEDPSTVIGSSKSEIGYDGLYRSAKAFETLGIKNVADNVANMKVGEIHPTQFDIPTNSMITYKLVNKHNAADTIKYTLLWAVADTPEKSAQLADSIKTALQNGANYAELAKKYKQEADTTTLNSAQYEGGIMKTDQAQFFNKLNTIKKGYSIITLNNHSAVVNIIDRVNVETKYDVAIVKCPLHFSKETFNEKLNKLNQFLAENQTLDLFIKNSGKNGFLVRKMPYAQNSLQIQTDLGGQDAKDAFKWVFDESKAGEVSKIYECGDEHEHLLVIGVDKIYDGKYLPIENENVKSFCEQKAKQIKLAELALNGANDVKDIAAAKKIPHAITLQPEATNFNWFAPLKVSNVNTPEPKLLGAIARTADKQFTGAVKGIGAVYFAQIQSEEKTDKKFDATEGTEEIAHRIMNNIFTQSYYGPQEVLLQQLMFKNGNETSYLFRF